MREILFRGKRIDNGEWVEGSLVIRENPKTYYIVVSTIGVNKNITINNMTATAYEVNPSTVGQFTGLTDKNGKRIFEGDILKFSDRLVYVHWHDICGTWDCSYIKAIDGMATSHEERSPNKWRFNAKIVGNLHDNREIWVVNGDD